MIKRRILAAILLLAFAIGSPFYWNNGEFVLFDFAVNLILAALGFVLLHFKWKRREDRLVTPQKARDIFS